MKNLSDCVSFKDQFIQFVASLLPVIVILQPSFKEFLILYVLEVIMVSIAKRYDGYIYTRIDPVSKNYFFGLDNEIISKFSDDEKRSFIHSIMRFPARRAQQVFITSFLKSIPSILVVVFYWSYEDSRWVQLWGIVGILFLNAFYFYGMVFLSAHTFLSNKIKKIHELYDWGKVFRNFSVKDFNDGFQLQIVFTFIAVIGWTLILQSQVIYQNQSEEKIVLISKVLMVAVFTFFLLGNMFYLLKRFFVSGLHDIFDRLDQIDFKGNYSIMPLHTEKILARFEISFNLLVYRLRISELDYWLVGINGQKKSIPETDAGHTRLRIDCEEGHLQISYYIGFWSRLFEIRKEIVYDPIADEYIPNGLVLLAYKDTDPLGYSSSFLEFAPVK
ncbi:MAG: hypothetical protein KDD34_04355 [Bdellovibrionales bacterium]|nr:hypothetical protein [Bdellovibrionales bacterium]